MTKSDYLSNLSDIPTMSPLPLLAYVVKELLPKLVGPCEAAVIVYAGRSRPRVNGRDRVEEAVGLIAGSREYD